MGLMLGPFSSGNLNGVKTEGKSLYIKCGPADHPPHSSLITVSSSVLYKPCL